MQQNTYNVNNGFQPRHSILVCGKHIVDVKSKYGSQYLIQFSREVLTEKHMSPAGAIHFKMQVLATSYVSG